MENQNDYKMIIIKIQHKCPSLFITTPNFNVVNFVVVKPIINLGIRLLRS